MPFNTYSPDLVYDPASRRGVAGVVAQVTDLLTGVPVATYDENGVARPVVTNPQGYIATFWTDNTVTQVMVNAGGIALPMIAQEMVGAGVDAAQAAQAAAEAAAALVGAPADTAIATAVASGATATDAALGAKFLRKEELVFNVARYGATGDGVTVDTTTIQMAVNAAPAGSQIFFPPDKVFNLGSGVIDLNKPLKLHGAKLLSTTGKAIRATADADIADVVITGPGTGIPYVNGNPGIEVLGTSGTYVSAKIRNCTIMGMRDSGIRLEFVRNFEVVGNHIENFRYGGIMVNSAEKGYVFRNTIKHAVQDTVGLSYGIAISDLVNTIAGRSKDVFVMFNHIEDIPEWEGLDTHGGLRINFSYNTVVDCRTGLSMGVGSDTRLTAPEQCVAMGNIMSAVNVTALPTTGIGLGGTSTTSPVNPLYADAVIMDNSFRAIDFPVLIPDSRVHSVDRVKSLIKNNQGDPGQIMLSDESDSGWVALTTYGAFATGYSSNSGYPTQIRVITDRKGRTVHIRGAVSVSAPATINLFTFSDVSLIPPAEYLLGLQQDVASPFGTFQLAILPSGILRTIFPSTIRTSNFIVSSTYRVGA